MAAENSPRVRKGREAPPAEPGDSEGETEHDHRFTIARIFDLHRDCPHAACKRHRTCSRPATVPCYGRHLAELRRTVFPQMRRDLARMQRERAHRARTPRQPRGNGDGVRA